eukprot:scaffold1012_cov418-Prasinococcus_capsulatus_cf.AAC.9
MTEAHAAPGCKQCWGVEGRGLSRLLALGDSTVGAGGALGPYRPLAPPRLLHLSSRVWRLSETGM